MDTILHILKAEGLYATEAALQRELEERYLDETEVRSREDSILVQMSETAYPHDSLDDGEMLEKAMHTGGSQRHAGDFAEVQAEMNSFR